MCVCRNIIEKSHSDLVDKRKEQEFPEVDGLLSDFNSVKESSWNQERAERRHDIFQQHRHVRLTAILVILILLLVLVLGLVG